MEQTVYNQKNTENVAPIAPLCEPPKSETIDGNKDFQKPLNLDPEHKDNFNESIEKNHLEFQKTLDNGVKF